MAEPSTEGGNNHKRSKPTLAISLSAGLIALCNLSSDKTFRDVAAIIAPAAGWGVAALIKLSVSEFSRWRFERMVNGWIKKLNEERLKPHTLTKRKREIDAEIADHQREIKKNQLDNFRVNYF